MTSHTHTARLSLRRHAATQWQHGIEANAAAFLAEVVDTAKKHRETVNRSFGQHIRYQMARQLRIRSEMVK